MPRFKVGDHVRWVHAVSLPEYKNAVGILEFVIPNDTNVEEFTMYDIKFPFGIRTLYGTQIEHVLNEDGPHDDHDGSNLGL